MLTTRLVVCLDVNDGRVVKGVEFQNPRDLGDPGELAAAYEAAGADEIVFLDIGAGPAARATLWDLAARTADRLFIPLTIGGGIRSVEDMRQALRSGADKVAINSAAVGNPKLLTEGATLFGAQCIVASIDARREEGGWRVYINGGRQPTDLDAVAWARQCATLGAGEILLTSIDRDGRRDGYDLELTGAVADAVSVPVIASGGAGTPDHLVEVLKQTNAAAALVAGILHDGVTTIAAIKTAMRKAGLTVRLETAPQRHELIQESDLELLDFAKGGGTVTVVAQEADTQQVLMVAAADREALRLSLETGEMHYRSRSRGLWRKGSTSGNTQKLIQLLPDCDGDAVLALVRSCGPACHTGSRSCFGTNAELDPVARLADTISRRAMAAGEGGYTRRLLSDRNLRLKKLGEETAELLMALADGNRQAAAEEGADLIYHLLVALQAEKVTWWELRQVLARRAK